MAAHIPENDNRPCSPRVRIRQGVVSVACGCARQAFHNTLP